MRAFKDIKVVRAEGEAWTYVIEIRDDAGGEIRLSAGFEDLDVIAQALESEFDRVIDAAERLGD